MPKNDKFDRYSILRVLIRSTVSAILTLAVGVALYLTLGPTVMAAVLFALACGVISVVTSYV